MATCMTTVPHYYVGTVGLEILLDTGVDLSEATAVSILVRREGGTETIWSAETYTEDGATTKVRHTTVSGDLDEAGIYRMHARVTLPGGTFTGTVADLLVENLYGRRS